jgi:hypothetical protein
MDRLFLDMLTKLDYFFVLYSKRSKDCPYGTMQNVEEKAAGSWSKISVPDVHQKLLANAHSRSIKNRSNIGSIFD